jgi:hypothetical protein
MASLPEDLWSHISWGTARSGQDVELLLIHNSGETKIRNQQVCVILWCSEEQVFGLEIAMYNAVIVEICDGGESRSNEIGGVGLVVVAFAANAIEELTTKGKIRDEVD